MAQKVCISHKRKTNTELFQTIPPSRLSASHLPLHKGGFGAKLVSSFFDKLEALDRKSFLPTAHLISHKSVPRHRFVTASPPGEAFSVQYVGKINSCYLCRDTRPRVSLLRYLSDFVLPLRINFGKRSCLPFRKAAPCYFLMYAAGRPRRLTAL